MALIVTAPVLPHTERRDEEAKANYGARRTGTPFLARFAQINVHLTLSDHTINIVDEHIDLATKVGEIRRVVCGSPDYFAGLRRPEDARRPRQPHVRHVHRPSFGG